MTRRIWSMFSPRTKSPVKAAFLKSPEDLYPYVETPFQLLSDFL